MSDALPLAPTQARGPAAWQVIAGTAAAYAAVGWIALALAVPPAWASYLYPSAGIALAAVLVYGRPALPGVALGAFLVNGVLSASRGVLGPAALWLPLAIAAGATLQAGLGAALLRRVLPQPLALEAPREIAIAGALGAFVACLASATVAVAALEAAGALAGADALLVWGSWWAGDVLGVLIGTPIALSLIGRPRANWAPRRFSAALPLLAATALLAAATLVIQRWDRERVAGNFERDAIEMETAAQVRLEDSLHALEALRSAHLAGGGLDAAALRRAAAWWLAQPLELQAMGFTERVPRARLAGFEATARAEGLADYRVFDRDAALVRNDADAVAVRLIEPADGNASALGINSLSVPGARNALVFSRDTGLPMASAGFGLTQSLTDETGFVIYQAVYDGTPGDLETRRRAFRGAVVVTVRAERLLADLAGRRDYLRWCLIDRGPEPVRPRLAGTVGCESESSHDFARRQRFDFAQRPMELVVSAAAWAVPGHEQVNAWLFSMAGLASAALLGALLLTSTGRTRRISAAVDERTAELRGEMRERQAAERAARAGGARLRAILDHVPVGVMFLDAEGRVIEANPWLARMLEQSESSLKQATLADLSHPDERTQNQRHLDDLVVGRIERCRCQIHLLRGDGGWQPVRAHFALLRGEDGAPRLAGAIEDISEHLRLQASEQALRMAEAASRAKSEFVSRMSHELRTPLNAMIGFAQLLGLDREPPLAAHQAEWVAQVQHAGWHLLEMINDTLDLARIEAGAVHLAMEPVDLVGMVAASQALVEAAAKTRRVSFKTLLAPGTAGVLADPTRLKQVLTNLLSNAVKYNREGGSVTIASRREGDSVVLAVADTGIGMTPGQLAQLFQPYNRLGREASAVEGTGIGLVISRRLVGLMGGTLEAASQSGAGSQFTLRLRAAALPAPGSAPAEAEAARSYHRRRVHYIEDNETNVEIMRGILARRPQVALTVSMNGLDGLAAVRQRRPDLILLDMQLPDISGLELLRHLKADDEAAGIPVVVVSADATKTRLQEALTAGASHYLTKPVDIPAFLAVLDGLLEEAESRWGVTTVHATFR